MVALSRKLLLIAVLLFLLTRVGAGRARQRRRFQRSAESYAIDDPVDIVVRPTRDIGDLDQPNELDAQVPKKPVVVVNDEPTGRNESSPPKKQKTAQYLVLPPDYNKYKLPWQSSAHPMQIQIRLEIRKVLTFDEIEEHMTLDLNLVVSWTDYKILNFRMNQSSPDLRPGRPVEDMTLEEMVDRKRIINDPEILSSIWKPNIFFDNLISIKQPYIMSTPVKLKVIPEAGFIEYITRLSVTVDCAMEFEYYPADTQTCEFSIRAFSYTSKLVRLRWHDFLSGVWLNDTTLPSFDVRVDDLEEKFIIDTYEDTEKVFDVLTFQVHVRRNLSYHVVQTYLASTFYIIITCLCFLLPPHMVEARIGISMTTLLTLTAMFASVRESTPITSYVKAIDTWMVCCIFFVFLTLAQFTFYTWLRGIRDDSYVDDKKKQNEKARQENHAIAGNGLEMNDVEIKSGLKKTRFSLTKKLKVSTMKTYEEMAFFIERFSFVIFLSIFGVFTLIYWTWLLLSSDYFNWQIDQEINMVNDYEYNTALKDQY